MTVSIEATTDRQTLKDALAVVTDQPRWVELRAQLLNGKGEVVGWDGATASGAIRSRAAPLAGIVGLPRAEVVQATLAPMPRETELIVMPEARQWIEAALPDWHGCPATLHTQPESLELSPPRADINIRLFDRVDDQLLALLTPDLRDEVKHWSAPGPAAAAMVERRAVSLVYVGAVTESWFDISVDTSPVYRRRGLAEACSLSLIERMHQQGRRCVWGALDDNEASLKLAAKLGFIPVDRLVVFIRGDVHDTRHQG